jgi:phosphatidylserine/phosphatidylglycerophosphate/cardiolipin synthase-like enzyme
LLEEAGIEIRSDAGEGLMNNKFIIVDRQFVWTGSTNVTVNGAFLNNNNVLILDSLDLAAIYEREFAELWAGDFGAESPETEEAQTLSIGKSAVQVFFGPEDNLAESLLDLVSGASSSVRIMAFSFTQDDLGAAVLDKYETGVAVQALFEARGSETEFSEMPGFFCAGVPVRQDGNPQTMSHKVMVIDELIVVTGSFNFSEIASAINDENVLFIVNPDIAARYLEEFNRLWEAGVEPPAETIACP